MDPEYTYISFNLHNASIQWILSLSFYRWKGSRRLRGLPKRTLSGRAVMHNAILLMLTHVVFPPHCRASREITTRYIKMGYRAWALGFQVCCSPKWSSSSLKLLASPKPLHWDKFKDSKRELSSKVPPRFPVLKPRALPGTWLWLATHPPSLMLPRYWLFLPNVSCVPSWPSYPTVTTLICVISIVSSLLFASRHSPFSVLLLDRPSPKRHLVHVNPHSVAFHWDDAAI